MKTIESTPAMTPPPLFERFIPSKAVLLDIAERVLILMVYGQFAVRLMSVNVASLNIGSILLMMSEAIPLFFVLFRKFSMNMSHDPFDWTVAIIGSSLPLLILPQASRGPFIPVPVAEMLIMLGLCAQIAAKVSLGRSFGIVAANRGVEISGPYRFVRHPMYLGYTMAHIGFLLLMPSVINAILYGLAFFLQVVRLTREERVLNQDPAYRDFAARVRYRLVPGVF